MSPAARKPDRTLPAPASSSAYLTVLGARLRNLRESRGLGRGEVAGICGITPGRLAKIEEGRGRLEASLIYDLAASLNVKVADIFQDASGDAGFELDPEAQRLIRLFAAIPDAGIRKSILKLAKSLSEKP